MAVDRWNGIEVIDDQTKIDPYHFGLIERNFDTHPVGYCCPAMTSVDIPLIDDSEVEARIKEMDEQESSLYHIIMRGGPDGGQIPTIWQDGWGYCWAHSTAHAVTALRARDNQPYVPLSAFAIAATIKKGRDQGGWGAQSLEFVQERGIPSQDLWPQLQTDYRKYDRPEVWANAALHKVTEGWVDLQARVYDRSLTWKQVQTLLLSRTPVVCDYNWWRHSVCALRLVSVERGSEGVLIWNSQLPKPQDAFKIIRGDRAIPDGAVAPTVVSAAA